MPDNESPSDDDQDGSESETDPADVSPMTRLADLLPDYADRLDERWDEAIDDESAQDV